MNEPRSHERTKSGTPGVFVFSCFRGLLFVLFVSGAAYAQPGFPTAIPQTKFNSGQDVVPYFEGWIRNKDGSFDMVFGYFNRNWQEELAIAPGMSNSVTIPGSKDVDHGQPTYFLPRRQGWAYRVTVPSNFGKQDRGAGAPGGSEVTWTIVANGKKEVGYGTLDPVAEITERIIQTRGGLNPGEDDPNRPPVVAVAPVASAVVATPVKLTATVTDDGLPKPRDPVKRTTDIASTANATRQANSNAAPRARGLTVSWMQLRGPAKVTFEKASGVAVVDGKATATATFAAPGTYVLRASANDGALTTKSDVTITVR